jgi:hypothetical protein
MKKVLSLAASGVVAAGTLLFAAPGTAQAGSCTPVDGGGYDYYVCGKIFNESNGVFGVAKGSPSTFYKWLWQGESAGYDGHGQPGEDIDGFLIEYGCSMSWNINSWPGPTEYGPDSRGMGTWYKIADTSSITVTEYTC